MKKYYVVYQTINLVNGNVYVGAHRTDNVEDDYLGSGGLLLKAIKKHGRENFSRKILKVFDDPDSMFEFEAQIVDESFVSRSNTYNAKLGGHGGWDNTDEEKRHGGKIYRKLWEEDGEKNRARAADQIRAIVARTSYSGKRNGFFGKHHTEETKKKIGQANSKKQIGKNNSVFGTCWIYSDSEKKSIRVKKEDAESWISKGWTKGRKMNFDNKRT